MNTLHTMYTISSSLISLSPSSNLHYVLSTIVHSSYSRWIGRISNFSSQNLDGIRHLMLISDWTSLIWTRSGVGLRTVTTYAH